jgi:hypothetical protein
MRLQDLLKNISFANTFVTAVLYAVGGRLACQVLLAYQCLLCFKAGVGFRHGWSAAKQAACLI